MKTTPLIESLESRIAPAGVTINAVAKTATWTDWDGDTVTLKYTSAKAPTFATSDNGLGLMVDKMTFNAADHVGDALTLTVKARPGGDGRVDLGRVDASGVPLKSWSSPVATISEFDCGNSSKAVETFVSGTLGAVPYGKFSNTGADGLSELKGSVLSFTVKGDILSTGLTLGTATGLVKSVTVRGDLNGGTDKAAHTGSLAVYSTADGTVTVGGSLIGGSMTESGSLKLKTDLAKVTVKGSVIGGAGELSGRIELDGSATNLAIGGSLLGASAASTGEVFVFDDVGTFTVGGNVHGGSGLSSGSIRVHHVGTMTIGGSVMGGSEDGTGVVTVLDADAITVKGSIVGGIDTTATSAGVIGGIYGLLGIKTLTVNGSLVGGTFKSGVHEGYNGFIATDVRIGTLAIKGSILGHDGEQALIVAKGVGNASLAQGAIGKLTVGGSVKYGYIAAGQMLNYMDFDERIGHAEYADATLGTVTVGGDWFHSNLSAGINDLTTNGITSADTRDKGNANLHATIAAIVIKGHVLDNPAASGYSGFAAEKIASITVHGVKVFKTGDAGKSLDAFGFVDVAEI